MVSATMVDELTVDIVTTDPDPILLERLVHFAIPAPNWLKTANLEAASIQAIGSGPYILAEYQKGTHMLFKANENYWGRTSRSSPSVLSPVAKSRRTSSSRAPSGWKSDSGALGKRGGCFRRRRSASRPAANRVSPA
jgi:ABC-type transport system substrate-binding protein